MITLKEQIEAVEDCIDFNRATDIPTSVDEAILASLRRLQEIEAQEPVATVDIVVVSRDVVTDEPTQYEAQINDSWGAINILSDGQKLFALPVSPEGYKLAKRLDELLGSYADAMPSAAYYELERIRAILAASEVSNG